MREIAGPSPEEMGLTIETEKPKKVFLEVGLSPNWKQGPLVFDEGSLATDHDMYVGLDYRAESVNEASSLAKEKGTKNALFVQADAQNTPFDSETIDTIYFGNVFGGVYDGDNAPEGTRDRFIQEARRILKPTGRVIIFENLTPENADDWGQLGG